MMSLPCSSTEDVAWYDLNGSPAARDGLGPLFHARSCSGCHLRDGRSSPIREPGEPLTGLLYFTATSVAAHELICDEGELYWIEPERFGELDIIETTAEVLPQLVGDVRDDLQGSVAAKLGLSIYRGDGALVEVKWQEGVVEGR